MEGIDTATRFTQGRAAVANKEDGSEDEERATELAVAA